MSRTSKVLVAGLILLLVAIISGVMFGVSVFLFAFSGGQYRMVAIVQYVAIGVFVAVLVAAAVVWRVRSPLVAATFAAIAAPITWVAALLVEWGLSFQFGAE